MNKKPEQGVGQESQKAERQEPQKAEQNHSLNFPVVGLGASAGGLKALLSFFEHLPADTGMAFVVILHLSPKHESNADAVLRSVTGMPVMQVSERVPIEPNRVYIIPPTQDLSMDDGYLQLSEAQRPQGKHVAIDLFFRTLADAHRERAICIILSGSGSDGTVGMKRVKEQGGIAMAQSPSDAEHDSMPRSAIATGLVDFVLPAAEIPGELIRLWHNSHQIQMPPAEDLPAPAKVISPAEAAKEAEDALRDILQTLRNRTGHDFTHYKRATVLRRIERRMQINHLQDLMQYRDYLRENPEETSGLLKDMLISVTNFFRDHEAYDVLDRVVIPKILMEKPPGEMIRVWVPGCATGEEAYSIAMLLAEHTSAQDRAPEFQIFATDIDEQAIATAREGSYPESIVADVLPIRLRNFFTKEPGRYRIKKSVREKILFATHNLIKDPPFSKLDLISCRNLLIYLNRDVQGDVLELLHFSLRPEGFLFLGSSESADAEPKLFTPVDKKHRIFRGNIVASSGVHVPTLPIGQLGLKQKAQPDQTREQKRLTFADLHQKLLEQYAPPSVIINYDYDIVHLSDRAGQFLQYVGGEPSYNLLKVVHPELRLDLRTALFQAIQTQKSVEARRVQLKQDDRSFYVNMIVRPVQDPDTNNNFILVLFDKVEGTMSAEADEAKAAETEPVVRQLEDELHRTKEQLQATIEQYETSNEELKASNEELQAINEELRSTTEELETSKEELQSINEELTTVNQELKNKVEETGKINDDLQNLIASTEIATVFVDRNMRIKRFTPRATDIFNIIPADVGRSLLDITHRLDYEGLADDTAEAFQQLRQIEREVRDHRGEWYIARFLPYRTTEDRIDGAVLTFINITGRREAEQRLRISEERLKLLIESAKDYAILSLDVQGRVNSWNKGAERMFGFLDHEILGQSGEILYSAEDNAHDIFEGEMKRAREQGHAEDERWHVRRDGTRLYCSGAMFPLRDDELKGYVKIARDLTEQKIREGERESLLKHEQEVRQGAERTAQQRDEFLAILTHELKNPLNLIQLNAEVLQRYSKIHQLPEVARGAETIRQTVAAQVKIIDDLLDLSRHQAGKLGLSLQPISLGVIVSEAAKVAQPNAAAKQLSFTIDLTDEPLTVEADAVRIEQIVWNLLSNAIKFTPPGGAVRLGLQREGEEAKLVVEDTGQGIRPDFLPYVFDMFKQGDMSTTKRHGGLGIGLALVRQLTELHGGRTLAESGGEGHGARFTVWLPLYGKSTTLLPILQSSTSGMGLQGLRVLVVDDDQATLHLMRTLLELEGASVEAALNAEQALRAAGQEDFHLILCDIAMPDVDGYTLIRQIRNSSRNSATPAIALTGFGREGDVEHALDAGFSAHLTKPIEVETLAQFMNKLIP